MPIREIKGVVQNGKIRLPDGVSLPENAEVIVTLADTAQHLPPQIRTPRLVNPAQAKDFRKQILELPENAGL